MLPDQSGVDEVSDLWRPGDGGSWKNEVSKLRKMGASLSNNPSMARAEANAMGNSVDNQTLINYFGRRRASADANRQRLGSYRTGSNMQIAMPKIRQPLGTLSDKGIPFNVEDEEELKDIRRWCRLFYATHDLVPLLIDIYSKFPVVGMEFDSKDPLIKKFYEDMFLGDDLNYLEFLPDQFGREYFTVGEVTSLAHFNESLGVWSSEEILNPDMLRISRSLFVQRDRVQLLVKDLVDTLRQGPMSQANGLSSNDETPSERLQRVEEYQELQKFYPEIIQAAAQDDGLDISEALISRVVNRPSPWAKRGAPHLLRSFRTLMMEESLNAAQDAVADRLYSPLILATLGIEDMGDGEPWIPDQSELDDTRDDMQTALAADFRLMVHNFGLKVENVFGRESVPDLSGDYDRVERKLLQAWGIGEALISGGTGGAYASSALNREFVTQIMTGFQNSLKRHISKRAEVIAEAQGHYDYDLKGGQRVPIYREIVEEDPETGKEYIRKVPKLIVNDPSFVKFSTLNLRDEAQERAFIAQLKSMGVPVSDKTLSMNIDMEFDQELERQADESVQKLMATAQAMAKVQQLCDQQNLPYPPELAQHLQATLQLRQANTQTQLAEAQGVAGEEQAELQTDQIEMQKTMLEQQMAGGAMPGQPMMPPGAAGPAPEGPPTDGPPMGQAMPPTAAGPGAPGPGAAAAGQLVAGKTAAERFFGAGINNINGPAGSAPAGSPPSGGLGPELPGGIPEPTKGSEAPRNRATGGDGMRQVPEESHDQAGTQPMQTQAHRMTKFKRGPSSYGTLSKVTPAQVTAQVQRLETVANWRLANEAPSVAQLVADPNFYKATNMTNYQDEISAAWPEIEAGGAHEQRSLLENMLDQFREIFGVDPTW